MNHSKKYRYLKHRKPRLKKNVRIVHIVILQLMNTILIFRTTYHKTIPISNCASFGFDSAVGYTDDLENDIVQFESIVHPARSSDLSRLTEATKFLLRIILK